MLKSVYIGKTECQPSTECKSPQKLKKKVFFFEEITVPKQFKELFDKNYFAMNSNLLLDLRYLL